MLNQNESRFPTMDNWVNIAIKPRWYRAVINSEMNKTK